jgi:hypothetical protein
MTATGPPAPEIQTSRTEIRHRRVRVIRKRTVAGSIAAFGVAWTIMFSQLVTGHDPALGNNQKASVPAAASSSSSSSGSSTSSGSSDSCGNGYSASTDGSTDNGYSYDRSGSASSTSSGSSSGSSSAPLAPMTTQQS